jgi:hypothetical protein
MQLNTTTLSASNQASLGSTFSEQINEKANSGTGARKLLSVLVDGTGLDRASRRLMRKVDLSALLKSLSFGSTPTLAKYYTIIPYDDDSRQLAFLDAVRNSGFQVVIKRLPPKGINKMVSVDVDMASDIMAFGLGFPGFNGEVEQDTNQLKKNDDFLNQASNGTRQTLHTPNMDSVKERTLIETGINDTSNKSPYSDKHFSLKSGKEHSHRKLVVVCPSKDISYPISLISQIGVDTITADFGKYNKTKDILKSAVNFIDLSDSENIWK